MALAIDTALLCFLMFLLLVFTGKNLFVPLNTSFCLSQYVQMFSNWLLLLPFVFAAVGMCYFCLMHAWCEQTIGKTIMGIKLTSRPENPLSIGICFLRWVGYFASALPFFFGFYWALLDFEGRTWHDRLAGTRVVYD
jgi:uncharacterized RDD family membrane protein YckC